MRTNTGINDNMMIYGGIENGTLLGIVYISDLFYGVLDRFADKDDC